MYRKTNTDEGAPRLFFALWPPPTAARALHAYASRAQALCGGRVTRTATLHLTLAFLGAVPAARAAALADCAGGLRAAPFDLELTQVRRWQHNGIVWAGPNAAPPGLADLAAQLATALASGGFRTEARAFHAHVTLLRRTERDGPLPDFAPVVWRAREFVLVRSALAPDGPGYTTLAHFALGVPARGACGAPPGPTG